MKAMRARSIIATFFISPLKRLKAWWQTTMRRGIGTGFLRLAAGNRRKWRRSDGKRRERTFGELTVWLLAFSVFFLIVGVVQVERLPTSLQASAYETLWRKATILGGVLTALAVLWRGLISSRQADKQAEQIQHMADQIAETRRQINVTETNILATLMKQATEDLGSETDAIFRSNLEILVSIATNQTSSFSKAASNLIVAGLNEASKKSGGVFDNRFTIYRQALDAIIDRGDAPTDIAQFKATEEEKVRIFPFLKGIKTKYEGGTVELDDTNISEIESITAAKTHFLAARPLLYADFGESKNFFATDCRFKYIHFKNIRLYTLKSNYFEDCDFSGCTIDMGFYLKGIKPADAENFHSCSYDADDPPIFSKEPTEEFKEMLFTALRARAG